MAAMAELGIKINGEWHNVTISINDETNEWGKNISVWKSQTKEERDAKAEKDYCGNGKCFWTDGTVKTAERKEQPQEANDGMPF